MIESFHTHTHTHTVPEGHPCNISTGLTVSKKSTFSISFAPGIAQHLLLCIHSYTGLVIPQIFICLIHKSLHPLARVTANILLDRSLGCYIPPGERKLSQLALPQCKFPEDGRTILLLRQVRRKDTIIMTSETGRS